MTSGPRCSHLALPPPTLGSENPAQVFLQPPLLELHDDPEGPVTQSTAPAPPPSHPRGGTGAGQVRLSGSYLKLLGCLGGGLSAAQDMVSWGGY